MSCHYLLVTITSQNHYDMFTTDVIHGRRFSGFKLGETFLTLSAFTYSLIGFFTGVQQMYVFKLRVLFLETLPILPYINKYFFSELKRSSSSKLTKECVSS